jgi:enoyl-CoA hydratase
VSDQVSFERDGGLGRIHLTRPQAINALSAEMIEALLDQVRAWRDDDRIHALALTGEGERGLCAGGDIRFVRTMATVDPDAVHRLWWQEYVLDLTLATFPKPIVAFADGITMGGGIGLAGHVSHRVVTTRSRLAMPETRIGLAPDVGGLWLLSRAPIGLGTHLALTGDSADGPASLAVGWADVLVEPEHIPAIVDGLRASSPDDVLPGFALATRADRPHVPVDDAEEWMSRCYAFDDVSEIVDALAAETDPVAATALGMIRSASPTAVAVTLAGLRAARDLTLAECLGQDYRLSCRFLQHPDLPEGIRARVVDKDSSPAWRPATLAEVSAEDVAAFFAPLAQEWDPALPFPGTAEDVGLRDSASPR